MLERSPLVTYETVDGQAVLVDPDGRELLTLNLVGTLVWEAIDGTRSEGELVDLLAGQFPDVERNQIGTDVRIFIGELRSSGLVTDDE